jgi:tetratricopeptide (TPR) repeat protein
MTLFPFRNASNVVVLSTCLGALAFSIGCESTPDPREMTEVQRAKAISSRRKQAEHEFGTFLASDGDDIEALKRYAQLHVETTTIAPSACELCFLNAGLALHRLGNYYRAEVLLLDRRLQDASPSEARTIEAEINKNIEVMRGYFLESNRHFETYIRQAGAIVNPDAYWRLADNYAALEDWRRALSYLDIFEQVQPLAEGESKSALAEIRSSFQTRLRLQEERQLEDELRRGGRSERPQPSN